MGSTLSIGFEGRVPAKLINMTNININQNNVNVNFVCFRTRFDSPYP
jgi:hypothetical protein